MGTLVTGHLRRLASDSLVYGLSSVASTLLGVILVPLYTRTFTPGDVGTISLITSLMALIWLTVGLALDNSVHRWFFDTDDAAERKASVSSWTWCQLVTSTLAAVGIIWMAPVLAKAVLGRPAASSSLRIAALALPMMTLTGVATNWLRMWRRPWATVSCAIGITLLTGGLTVVFLVHTSLGISGVFLAQAIAQTAGALLAIGLLRDWISPRHFDLRRLRGMLRYALPLLPAIIAFWSINLIDRYFVHVYASSSELGLYQVGYQVSALVGFVVLAFQQAFIPFALSLHQEKEARSVYARVLPLYLWSTCLLSVVLTIFAPELLAVFTSESYYGSASVVFYLTFSYVMFGLTYIAQLGASIARTTVPVAVAMCGAGVLTVVLLFVLVPPFGKEGAAIATLIAWSCVPFYIFRKSQKAYPVPYHFRSAVGLVGGAMSLAWLGSTLPLHGRAGFAYKVGIVLLFIPAIPLFKVFRPIGSASDE